MNPRPSSWILLASLLCGPLAPSRGAAQDDATPAASESLDRSLRAEDKEIRRAVTARLRLAGRGVQGRALPVLIDLLMKEKDGQVRLAVLDIITSLGPEAESAVPALLHTMRTNYGGQGQEESHQDYRSALALAAIGKPAVEGLRGLLKERKESVRAEAIMGLGRIGPAAADAVADLTSALGDKSERIRREASTALGRIGLAAIGPLVAAAEDREAAIRSRAFESLGHLSKLDDRVLPALRKGSGDPDPIARAEAIRSLGRVGCPDAIFLPVLRENLRHEDETVRRAAVDGLLGRRAMLASLAPDLESLLLVPEDGVARHAAFLLARSGPDAAPRLMKALPRPESRIDQVAEALGQVGRPSARWLIPALKDPDPRVRRGSALALGQIRPVVPGIVPELVAGLDDPDPAVRLDVLAAIGHLGPRAAEAVPTVRGLLKDRSPAIRLRVVDILAGSAPRDDRLVDDLSALLLDEDEAVQVRAIDLLRSLGPPGRRPLSAVVDRLASPDAEVRRSAVEYLESHGQAAAEAVPALADLLADPVPRIRMTAAQTLGKIGKPAQPAFDRMAGLVGDERPEVREVAAFALGNLELDAGRLRGPIARALRDEKAEVRRSALKSVQRLGPEGALFVPDIIGMAATRENQRLVDRSLRPFERTGPDLRSLPELIRQLDHPQVAVRLLAIKFLGLAGREAREAIPALERFSDDPVAEVRQQARAACEQIRAGAGPTADKERGGG